MNVRELTYGSHRAVSFTLGGTEIVVSVDAGPRVLRFSETEESNLFYQAPALQDPRSFQPIGGHRLWIAPENAVTYYPDNHSVQWHVDGGEVTFRPPPEAHSERLGLQKELVFSEGEAGTVRVEHRVSNVGVENCTISPWAITMMQGGGVAILPLTERAPHDDKHLLPNSQLAMWSYTDFADARWRFLPRHLTLRHDPQPCTTFSMQKTGLFHPNGWLGYVRGKDAFVKTAPSSSEVGPYPDRGCNIETFTNPEFLELETLGPLVALRPGEQTTHTELWKTVRLEQDADDLQESSEALEGIASALRQTVPAI